MFSMPPATATSTSPQAIACAAKITVLSPEPQTLLTVVQGVLLSRPAPIAAWRAGAWPMPAARTQPMYNSPTSPAPTLARSRAARMAMAPSSVAGTLEREERKEPIGVRAALTITTSRMGVSPRNGEWPGANGPGCRGLSFGAKNSGNSPVNSRMSRRGPVCGAGR